MFTYPIWGGGVSPLSVTPVSWWPHEDVLDPLDDEVGSNDLVQSGSYTAQTGVVNNCLYADNANCYLTPITGTGLDTTGSYSIAMWVRWDTFNSGTLSCIAYRGTENSTSDATRDIIVGYLQGDSKVIYVHGKSDGTSTRVDSPQTITLGNWNLVCVAYDATAQLMKISVNNENFVTTPYTDTPMLHDYFILRRGPLSGVASNWDLDGAMDEAAFFSGAFTQDDVTWLWNSGSGRSHTEL